MEHPRSQAACGEGSQPLRAGHARFLRDVDAVYPLVWLPLYRRYAEGNLSRADSLSYDAHERILDLVSRGRERIRSHDVRHLSGSLSVESPHNLLQGKSV